MAESFSFEIIKRGPKLGATSSKGWTKELNQVAWNDREPKWDIREWNEDYSKCGRGVTLTDEELAIMGSYLYDNGLAQVKYMKMNISDRCNGCGGEDCVCCDAYIEQRRDEDDYNYGYTDRNYNRLYASAYDED